MKRRLTTLLIAAAVVVLLAVGWMERREPQRAPATADARPSATTRAPSLPTVSAQSSVQSTEQHNAQLQLEIERALVARDPQQRETAFNFLLPELLRADPHRVVDLVARQEPGETRDALRNEVARQWITLDRTAAVGWLQSLDDEAGRLASARVAVGALAADSPGQAIEVADVFNVGRDDGSLEHIVQIWAEEDLDGATRWLDSQPAGPHTEQLRARIEQVRARRSPPPG